MRQIRKLRVIAAAIATAGLLPGNDHGTWVFHT